MTFPILYQLSILQEWYKKVSLHRCFALSLGDLTGYCCHHELASGGHCSPFNTLALTRLLLKLTAILKQVWNI